ncbi:hypothetical protein [Nostoc sp. FACHB-133]|uniref:hypothetical protein n=1 Tax=Nostoc sp. FACHB-133 TaxID=2692835 RepID=UPI00168921AE|nr:hypothetical protein [Nostoc sp. FACHB-133]MBD2525220.1 hypothetical protein [Nostoc sp. FACHB-133]
MIVIEDLELFTQISVEESATINGAGLLTAAAYITLATLLNIPDDIKINTALLFAINSQPPPGAFPSP